MEAIIAGLLNILGIFNYKRNPYIVSLLLTIVSVLLLGTSVYLFFTNSEFLIHGKTAKNVSISEAECYVVGSHNPRTYCTLYVQYQTQKGEVQKGLTTESYIRNFVIEHVVYLPQAPHHFRVNPISLFLIFFLLALAIVLFVLSRLILQQGNNYNYLEKKLKRIGKYYKTRFVEITEENIYFKEYYYEPHMSAVGKYSASLESRHMKTKHYKIKTILKIKAQDNVLEFYSRELRAYNPRKEVQEFITQGNKIGVWVNPSKPSEYYMDISFLDY